MVSSPVPHVLAVPMEMVRLLPRSPPSPAISSPHPALCALPWEWLISYQCPKHGSMG
jgi:hypothetical protein